MTGFGDMLDERLLRERIIWLEGEVRDENSNRIAKQLPMRMLGRLLGVPDSDGDWLVERGDALLGNFDPNPDPIRRDNIMFSAFFGDVLNIYEAATGSTRFDQPGSLPFVWKDGRTFAYDHHSIIAAVEDNYQRSSLGFFPCEPGWSFTVCNVMGAQSLFGHDRLHGTHTWDGVKPTWVRTLENEYLTPDGSYAHIKSNLVGLAWDTGGGLIVNVAPHVAVRGDVRYFHAFSDLTVGPLALRNVKLDFGRAAGGLVFSF